MNNINNQNQIKQNIKRQTGRALLLALVFVFSFMALVAADTAGVKAAPEDSADNVVQMSGVQAGAYEVTTYTLRATVQKDHS